MNNLLLIVLALIWLAGTLVRIYRQARFFQIEEYMNRRYLRWWMREQERLLPKRPLIAFIVGGILAFVLSESPNSPLPAFVALIAALVAVWPPDEGEIKKRFRRTGRATRILGAAFLSAALVLGIGLLILSRLDIDDYELNVIAVSGIGLALVLTAPLFLVIGNLAMIPVEAFLRRRFLASAKAILERIHPTVIGVTGSYGKTTTKNFIAEILNGRFRTYPTPKSYNTMMGVSLAINTDLKDDYSIDYFIVEMGAYIRGEIERICTLTPPQIAVITEVGPQHLERFGSLENIANAKYEIIKNLPPDGVGVFNWDNAYIRDMMAKGYPQTRIGVSREAALDGSGENAPRFIASDIAESLDGLTFAVHDRETDQREAFFAPVLGVHNVTNILLATAVAIHEGMSLQEIAFRVKTLKPSESRLVSRTTPQGITIINDAYSANPSGIISALRVLKMHDTGRRLLVTPGMVELGDLHEPENRRLGEIAAENATDVILVGKVQTQPIHEGLMAAGFPPERLRVVEELREAMAFIEAELRAGDTVLFLNDLPDTY